MEHLPGGVRDGLAAARVSHFSGMCGCSGSRTRQDHAMRIAVLAIENEDVGLLRCATLTGELLVRWRGAMIPTPGEWRDVELELVGELTWGENVGLVGGAHKAPGTQALVGTIEAIDGDQVVLRIGDGLVLAEVRGQAPSAARGKSAFVHPRGLEAWPTGI